LFKKILMASLAVGAMALNAPVAHADDPTYGCSFNSVRQADVTVQNYEGAIWGYVVDTDASSVSIRCYITVNGTPVASTTPGNGTVAAHTEGRATFQAADTDSVKLWSEATVTHGTTTQTFTKSADSTHTQVPPQEVIDILDGIFATLDGILIPLEEQYVDPTLCTVLSALPAGDYGPITIGEDGDISLLGDLFWDCPPYVPAP
jgi:hypothetical protein